MNRWENCVGKCLEYSLHWVPFSSSWSSRTTCLAYWVRPLNTVTQTIPFFEKHSARRCRFHIHQKDRGWQRDLMSRIRRSRLYFEEDGMLLYKKNSMHNGTSSVREFTSGRVTKKCPRSTSFEVTPASADICSGTLSFMWEERWQGGPYVGLSGFVHLPRARTVDCEIV